MIYISLCACLSSISRDHILENMYLRDSIIAVVFSSLMSYLYSSFFQSSFVMTCELQILHLMILVPALIYFDWCDFYMFSMLLLSVIYLYSYWISLPYLVFALWLWVTTLKRVVETNCRLFVSSDENMNVATSVLSRNIVYQVTPLIEDKVDSVYTFVAFMFNVEVPRPGLVDVQWHKFFHLLRNAFPRELVGGLTVLSILCFLVQKNGYMIPFALFACVTPFVYAKYDETKTLICVKSVQFFLVIIAGQVYSTILQYVFGGFSIKYPEESFVFFYILAFFCILLHLHLISSSKRGFFQPLLILLITIDSINMNRYVYQVEFAKARLLRTTSIVHFNDRKIVFVPKSSLSYNITDGPLDMTTSDVEEFWNAVKNNKHTDTAILEVDGFQMPLAMCNQFRTGNKWRKYQVHRDLVKKGMQILNIQWETGKLIPQEAQDDFDDFLTLCRQVDMKALNVSSEVNDLLQNYFDFVQLSVKMSNHMTVGEIDYIPIVNDFILTESTIKSIVKVLLNQASRQVQTVLDNGEFEH